MPVLKSRRSGQDLRSHPLVTVGREHLRAAAIIRGGAVLERGFKSHYELRAALTGDGDHREPNDIEGFVTTSGRFVGRREAKDVAVACGQLKPGMTREVLSSDIDW